MSWVSVSEGSTAQLIEIGHILAMLTGAELSNRMQFAIIMQLKDCASCLVARSEEEKRDEFMNGCFSIAPEFLHNLRHIFRFASHTECIRCALFSDNPVMVTPDFAAGSMNEELPGFGDLQLFELCRGWWWELMPFSCVLQWDDSRR